MQSQYIYGPLKLYYKLTEIEKAENGVSNKTVSAVKEKQSSSTSFHKTHEYSSLQCCTSKENYKILTIRFLIKETYLRIRLP